MGIGGDVWVAGILADFGGKGGCCIVPGFNEGQPGSSGQDRGVAKPIPVCIIPSQSQSGGIGRHARLKIWWPRGRVGSSPTSGTN